MDRTRQEIPDDFRHENKACPIHCHTRSLEKTLRKSKSTQIVLLDSE